MTPEEREARGNPGTRAGDVASVAAEETARSAALPPHAVGRPSWLTDEVAGDVWDQLQSGDTALRFIRESDVNAFGRYCVYLADWVAANEELVKDGAVYETSSAHVEKMKRINPWFIVRDRLEDNLQKLEPKFGLTPIDRQRLYAQLAAAAQLPPGDLFGGGSGENDAPIAGEAPPDPETPAEAARSDMQIIGGLNRLN
jgi:P27 family predicted phage terminase small subunit